MRFKIPPCNLPPKPPDVTCNFRERVRANEETGERAHWAYCQVKTDGTLCGPHQDFTGGKLGVAGRQAQKGRSCTVSTVVVWNTLKELVSKHVPELRVRKALLVAIGRWIDDLETAWATRRKIHG